jgi:hypothetical protein
MAPAFNEESGVLTVTIRGLSARAVPLIRDHVERLRSYPRSALIFDLREARATADESATAASRASVSACPGGSLAIPTADADAERTSGRTRAASTESS